MKLTIELDCKVGGVRPNHLIDGVVEGLGLEVGETVSRSFGNWVWEFEISESRYEEIKPILSERIIALYNDGAIRYGSW